MGFFSQTNAKWQTLPTLPDYALLIPAVTMHWRRERDGIPAHLLALLDATVEIPQLGVIRSLNVHVSGAIAAYSYSEQWGLRAGA